MRYIWKDNNTDKLIEVSRSLAEMDSPPDKQECLEAGFDINEYADAQWERQISQIAFLGPKGKGSW